MPPTRAKIEKFPVGYEINLWHPLLAGRKMFPSPRGPTAAIGDGNALCAPAILAEWSSAMQRRSFKHVMSFPDDLTQEAERLRGEAEKLRPGTERHDLERKARQAETAAHIDEWLKSPGLRPPE
jgi:hypothetical protein